MSDEYQVEEILGKRIKNGKVEYKIKWEGFSIKDSTWEPIQHLSNVVDMIEDFENAKENLENDDSKKKEKAPISPQNGKKKQSTQPKEKFLNNKRKNSNSEEDKSEKLEKNKKEKIPQDEDEEDIKYIKVVSINKDFKADVLVEKDGIPSKITMTTAQLKKLNPDILIDFYESKIKFTVKQDK